MAMKPKIQKSATSDTYYKIKYLNKWLLDFQNKIPIDLLLHDEKLFNSNFKYRLFNLLQNHPRVIRYLNKHLNGLYFFSQNTDISEWLETFKKIIYDNKINQLYFFKFQALNIDKFNDSLKKFCEETNSHPFNTNEIANLFKLYQNGLITLPGEVEEVDASEIKNAFTEEIKIINIPKSESIINLINTYNNYKNKRSPCTQCPAFYSKMLILDTNLTEIKPANIVVITDLAPTAAEIEAQQFLVDPNGKIFKSNLQRFVDRLGITYVISTLSFCELKGDGKKQIKQCKDFISEIDKTFNPDYIVLAGMKIKSALEIKGAASKLHGQAIGKYFFVNAIADLDKKDGILKLDQAFMELEKLLASKPKVETIAANVAVNQSQPQSNTSYNPTPQVQNSNITKQDTLLNIERIGEKLLYVFIDPNGNKKFNLINPEFPVYYKKGDFAKCNYIDSEMDAIINLTLAQKKELSTLLNQKLHNLIKC